MCINDAGKYVKPSYISMGIHTLVRPQNDVEMSPFLGYNKNIPHTITQNMDDLTSDGPHKLSFALCNP